MDVGSTLRVLLRRWLVFLLGMVLTVGVAAYVYTQSPARYQATSRVLLLLPSNARGEIIGSPFLHLPSELTVLADLVSLTPRTASFRAEMADQGLISQYEIGVDDDAPVLTISVEGSDPADVIATRDRLVVAIQDELARVQEEEDAPPQQVATARVYAADPVPGQMGGDRMRAVLAVLASGGLLTLLLTFMVDRLVQVVRTHRARPTRPAGGRRSRQEGGDRRRPDVPGTVQESTVVARTASSVGSPPGG